LLTPLKGVGIDLIPLRAGQPFDPLVRLPAAESLAVQKNIFFGKGMQEDFLRACEDFAPDLVVVDFCQVSTIALANRLGLTTVILTHTLLGRILPHWDRTFLAQINDCLASAGLSTVNSTLEFWEKSQAVLAATTPLLDEDYAFKSSLITYTGPIFEPAKPPQHAFHGIDSSRPRVLISFSTTFMEQLGPLRQAILAVSELDVIATVTTGPAILPSELPEAPNVEVIKWASHAEILPQVTAAIVHAGHSSVSKALSFGVPLLCIPLGRDQHYIAERVAHAGAGLVVQSDASFQEIKNNLLTLLRDKSYGINAKRMAGEMRLAGRGEHNGARLLERLYQEQGRPAGLPDSRGTNAG
jgi:hypothetical protein